MAKIMSGLSSAVSWGDIAQKIIVLGAPALGTALGGPLGGAAGAILAQALGVEPTPAAVDAVVKPGAAPAADVVAQAETAWLTALAETARVQVAEVGQTQRAEIASDDPLQRWWRPLYALELSLVECPAFALTLLRAIWLGDDSAIAGLMNVSALLIAYFGARFGVLGVYVSGRSREKQASATGECAPSALAEMVKAFRRK